MGLAVVAILALVVGMGDAAEMSVPGRKLLAGSCSQPPKDSLSVPGSFPIIEVGVTGRLVFFCNNGTLAIDDGEAFADLRSDDGQWVGYHDYPETGENIGTPHWYLNNTITGETRVIYGENKPMVKKPSPTGADIDWSRRLVYGDVSSLDQQGPNGTIIDGSPKTWYVVRTETTSGGKPNSTVCAGDIDVETPFTARYTFLSCDYYGRPPPMAPNPAPSMAPALLPPLPAPAPLPALVPAPTPALFAVPAPAPGLLVAAPAPGTVPMTANAPAPAEQVLPSVPVVALADPPPAPSAATSVQAAATLAAALLLAVML